MIDHDRIFKEFLTVFFIEFLELFFPDLMQYLDPTSIEFLDKEIFLDTPGGKKYAADIVVKARFRGTDAFFLVLIESQAQVRLDDPFDFRLFRYVTLLHFKYRLRIYPIALFSHDQVSRIEPDSYHIGFPDFDVLHFQYRVVQLNRLHWRDYVGMLNPVASALLVKMGMRRDERPEVLLTSLRSLPALQLDPARLQLVLGFIHTYLKLTPAEEARFQTDLAALTPTEQEATMELMTMGMEKGMTMGMEKGMTMGMEKGMTMGMEKGMTMGMEKGMTMGIEKGMTMGIEKGMTMGIEKGMTMGIQQGRQEGRQEGQSDMILLLLTRQVGALDAPTMARIHTLTVAQLEALALALFDFAVLDDLHAWLVSQPDAAPAPAAADEDAPAAEQPAGNGD